MRLAWVRGDPFPSEALGFIESGRRQQDCNSVFSLTRLQEGYDAITSIFSRGSPSRNASTG